VRAVRNEALLLRVRDFLDTLLARDARRVQRNLSLNQVAFTTQNVGFQVADHRALRAAFRDARFYLTARSRELRREVRRGLCELLNRFTQPGFAPAHVGGQVVDDGSGRAVRDQARFLSRSEFLDLCSGGGVGGSRSQPGGVQRRFARADVVLQVVDDRRVRAVSDE